MPIILSPEGPIGPPPRRLSPLPRVLAGVRLGVLDNRKPNARLLLTTMAERLAERTGARLVLVAEKANAAVRSEVQVLERLRDETDVVLTGSGD
jgi:hypothetical protein